MGPKLKLEQLKRRVLHFGAVEKRLKVKARTDMLADAALIAVKTVLENAQDELHRHVRTYDLRS